MVVEEAAPRLVSEPEAGQQTFAALPTHWQIAYLWQEAEVEDWEQIMPGATVGYPMEVPVSMVPHLLLAEAARPAQAVRKVAIPMVGVLGA